MDTPQPSTPIEIIQSDDFRNVYANHVYFETSVWDLKLIFGQLDQKIGANSVVQHTAITLPWTQVKVMLYFLQLNLLVNERLNGRVRVPSGVIPNPEQIAQYASGFREAEPIIKMLSELFEKFAKENPESTEDPIVTPKKKSERT